MLGAHVGVQRVPGSKELQAHRTDVTVGLHVLGLDVVLDVGALGGVAALLALPSTAAQAQQQTHHL